MADSRRINANIREEDEKRPIEEHPPFGVYAVILSSEFWPPFKDEKLEVPEDIRAALDVYCKKYEKLKVQPVGLLLVCISVYQTPYSGWYGQVQGSFLLSLWSVMAGEARV